MIAPADESGVPVDGGPDHPELVAQLVADVEAHAILLLDLAGNVLTWNAGAERANGYKSEQIIGRHFSIFYPPEDVTAGKPERELETAAAEGRVEDEGWRLRQDGTAFWASVVITALRDPDGTLRGYGKVTRDLTERRVAELALRARAERLRQMIEGVEDYAILMLDLAGNVTSWNAGARHLKGYRSDQIVGQHFSVLYPPDDIAAGKPARELEIAAAEGHVEDEGWRLRQDGSHFWAHVVITALRDQDGTLQGYGKVTRNLSARERDDYPLAFEFDGDHPVGTTAGRGPTPEARERTAQERDRRADAHDLACDDRDERSAERDRRAEAREQAADAVDAGSVSDRAAALRDRLSGAKDRRQAADDRAAASEDRQLAAQERQSALIDQLTGTYRRDTGIVELRREVARAGRMKQPFVLAFVDLDDMKGTNDSNGHATGDDRLRQTADMIRAHFRHYDLIVRFGGDEFLAGLPDMTIAEATTRFLSVNARLAVAGQRPLSVGFAQIRADDSLELLIARADADMYKKREARRRSPRLSAMRRGRD